MTALGTHLPPPVSLKKALKVSSCTAQHSCPVGAMPCSRQYSSQHADPTCTPACPTCSDTTSRCNGSQMAARWQHDHTLGKPCTEDLLRFTYHLGRRWDEKGPLGSDQLATGHAHCCAAPGLYMPRGECDAPLMTHPRILPCVFFQWHFSVFFYLIFLRVFKPRFYFHPSTTSRVLWNRTIHHLDPSVGLVSNVSNMRDVGKEFSDRCIQTHCYEVHGNGHAKWPACCWVSWFSITQV